MQGTSRSQSNARTPAQATRANSLKDAAEIRLLQARIDRLVAANDELRGRAAELRDQRNELLSTIDPEADILKRCEWWTEGRRAGFWAGVDEGRRQAFAEMAADWNRIATPAAHPGPSFAELERRRWGPGGRANFGDPRTDDFRGADR